MNKESGSNSNLISKPVMGALVFWVQTNVGVAALGLQALFGVSGMPVVPRRTLRGKNWSRAP